MEQRKKPSCINSSALKFRICNSFGNNFFALTTARTTQKEMGKEYQEKRLKPFYKISVFR